MRQVFFIMSFAFLASSTWAADKDSTARNNAEITLGIGVTMPQLRDYNQIIIAAPKPGPRVSLGFNYLFNKKNKPFFLSVGGRLIYTGFSSYEESDKYIFHDGFRALRKYDFKNIVIAVGAPVRINYTTPIARNHAFLAGAGLFPCLQTPSIAEKNPFSMYADVYAGFTLTNRLAVTLEANHSMHSYPRKSVNRATYGVWGLSIELRYCINPFRIY